MPIIHTENNKDFHFFCPGCQEVHSFNDSWQFNYDIDKPTVFPSILVKGTRTLSDDEYEKVRSGEKIEPRILYCHSYIKNGEIQFLNDSLNELAGQTVALQEFKFS